MTAESEPPAEGSGPTPPRFCEACGSALANPAGGVPSGLCPPCTALGAAGRRLCPFCRESVLADARKCPFCDELLDLAERRKGYARYNVCAILGLAAGIMGCLFCLPGIAGIVLGAVGARQIERSGGTMRGETMARWGIVLGILWALIWFALLVALSVFGQ